jgi:hypothetical protein
MMVVPGGAISAAFGQASPVTFEALNCSLMRLGFFAGSESPKIAKVYLNKLGHRVGRPRSV